MVGSVLYQLERLFIVQVNNYQLLKEDPVPGSQFIKQNFIEKLHLFKNMPKHAINPLSHKFAAYNPYQTSKFKSPLYSTVRYVKCITIL
jgi:hypothetical protein